ncbi:hypothetical protein PR202_ga22191 [Eleusine coracana subsp. coracana]|uniref:Uncharacterized protein n=1 Tax=Eleusine coracana subsp. coracana TaxID=191504 RepID=A0AAV5D3B1_ELECO|nr:hypothetical protein PR202_ga22191 [Eleusine coracana subsp. coracana]
MISMWPKGIYVTRELILHLLGIRFGLDNEPTVVVRDNAVAADALLRHADDFCDRPAGMGGTSVVSGGRLHTITTQPYGPAWVALRRNLSSEAFHPVRGLERAAAHRQRALAKLVGDIAATAGGVVHVQPCLYSALLSLNMATCFGDDVGVESDKMEDIREALEEFRRSLNGYHVFTTFQKLAKLVYWGRWRKLVNSRKRVLELFLPLIRACKERRRLGHHQNMTSPSYVDTLLELNVPVAGTGHPQRRQKLSEDEVAGLVLEYMGAGTETIVALLEWTLANLVVQPDVQSRLRHEIIAAGGEACEYLRAVVMESLRRHPPFRLMRRQIIKRDTFVGNMLVARGTVVNIALEEIGRDSKVYWIWTYPEKFIPERFMPGGEGAEVRLSMGSSTADAGKVMMMPFGAGPRKCPGMGNAILLLEYFLRNLVTAFEWHQVDGQEVDLQPHYGFFTIMDNPLRARVKQLTTVNAAV